MAADNTHSPLEKFVARATQLYTLPKVAMEVVELTNCPQVDAGRLKDCIQRDPALVSKILRTVNSSVFGGVRNVTDLNQAIALLGSKPLKLLVLGFSLPPKLLSGIEAGALSRYWKRTLVKAIAARELAAQYDNVDPDDAFLSGLLQDIGMLALLKELGEPYAQFLKQAQSEHADLVMLELETLGFDHRLLSARMMQSWGLPESLWRTIAASTSIDALPRSGSPMGEAVSVLASAHAVALLITQQQPAALAAVMQREDQSDIAWWTQFAADVQEQVKQLSDIFNVAPSQLEQFDKVVREAHAQLSLAAEDAAQGYAKVHTAPSSEEICNLENAVRSIGNAAMEILAEDRPIGANDAAHSQLQSATATAVTKDESGLLSALAASVTACRRRRQPLSFVLLEVDEFEELVFQSGGALAASLANQLRANLESYLEAGQQVLVAGDGQMALLLAGDDRLEAVAAARRVLDESRSGHLLTHNGEPQTMSMSIGIASVALPAKNFRAVDLHEAALRCLFAVQSCGGDNVKSIDVY